MRLRRPVYFYTSVFITAFLKSYLRRIVYAKLTTPNRKPTVKKARGGGGQKKAELYQGKLLSRSTTLTPCGKLFFHTSPSATPLFSSFFHSRIVISTYYANIVCFLALMELIIRSAWRRVNQNMALRCNSSNIQDAQFPGNALYRVFW